VSVRTLWSIVAAVWIALCVWLGLGGWAATVGCVLCVIFAMTGFLAGKHGVYR
jgi:hypothetical protein